MDCPAAAATAADDDCREEESFRDEEALGQPEKYWFFRNFQNQKSTTTTVSDSRCLPDPCTGGGCSSAHRCPKEEFLTNAKPTTDVDNDDGGDDEEVSFRQKLTLAACKEGKSIEDCYSEIKKGNEGRSGPKASDPCLVRAPSLPPNTDRAEVFREENVGIGIPRTTMPRRQVSLNPSDLQPRRHSSMGMLQRTSTSRYRSNRYLNSIDSGKSLSDLEHEEVQGFKDLGFLFEDKDLNRNLVGILPGLKEKRIDNAERDVDNTIQSPYLSEAWIAQSHAPPAPIPKWNPKDEGSTEDVKAHIRHWARAVASNVRY